MEFVEIQILHNVQKIGSTDMLLPCHKDATAHIRAYNIPEYLLFTGILFLSASINNSNNKYHFGIYR